MADEQSQAQVGIPQSKSQPVTQIIYSSDLNTVKPPNWESNDSVQEFRKFRRYCEIILSTPLYTSRTGSQIVTDILLWLGPQGVEIFDNMSNLSEKNKTNPDSIWEAFRTYFKPKSNYRLARFQLRDMRQLPNEPIESFMTYLHSQAQKCKFSSTAETEDNLIH
jgi:hypothetical protein